MPVASPARVPAATRSGGEWTPTADRIVRRSHARRRGYGRQKRSGVEPRATLPYDEKVAVHPRDGGLLGVRLDAVGADDARPRGAILSAEERDGELP